MKAGDTLVYGNGQRVVIVNFPDINGQPGVQVDDPTAIIASQCFRLRSDVDSMVSLGVWKIEKRKKSS